jgi:hypothetical protein
LIPICLLEDVGVSVSFLQLIEHDPKVFVVRGKLSDHSGELTIEFFVRFQHLAQSDKSSHDGDVYFDGLFAVQQFSTVDSMATVSCNLLI